MIAAGLVLGCSEQAVHDHATESMKVSATAYDDSTELLATYAHLIADQVSELRFHFSRLHPYAQPIKGAVLTVSIVVNGNGVRKKARALEVPGTYAVALQLNESGTGALLVEVSQENGGTSSYSFPKITVFPDRRTASLQLPGRTDANNIHLSKSKIWSAKIDTEVASVMPLEAILKASGQIIAAPGQEFTIAASASGIVKFTRKNLIEGAAVGGGQNLFSIAGGNMNVAGNIDLELRQATNELQIAEDEYRRTKELLEEKLITRDKYQQAALQYHNNKNRLHHLRKNYSGGSKQLSSPMKGYVKELLAQEGQYVTAGQPLATISRNQKVLLQVNLPLKEAGRRWQHASFRLQQDTQVFDTRRLNGRVVAAATSMHANSPWLPVYFEIEQHPLWVPGTFAEVNMKTGDLNHVLAVPQAALSEEQGSFYVYVQTGGDSFEKREVQLGRSDGERIEVVEGISAGERIVVKGTHYIRLAASVGSADIHEHAH